MAVRTENLCILFTDIAGFTEASSQLSREQSEKLLDTHNKLLLPIVRAFKGKHVKSIGDALLLTFKSPTDAMLCAMAMQDQLHHYNLTCPAQNQIHIRVAASLGEVRVTKNDIFGDPVNLTSRIEGITPVDEIYLSEAVYLAMNKAEVPIKEIGPCDLKGISGPVKIFSIPRYSTNRLVPDQPVPTIPNDKVQYPFGGAHLAAPRNQRVVPDLADLPIPQNKWMAATLVAVTLLLILVLFSSSASREPAKPTTIASSSAPVLAPAVSSFASRSSEPRMNASARASSSSAASAQVAAFMDAFNQMMSRSSSSNVQVKSEISSNSSSSASSASSSAARSSATSIAAPAPTAVVVRKIIPLEQRIRRFSEAKQAYRDGKLTKPSYRMVVERLDAERDARITALKNRYRSGTMSKAAYAEAVRSVKLSYE